jgi:hypothetical protein
VPDRFADWSTITGGTRTEEVTAGRATEVVVRAASTDGAATAVVVVVPSVAPNDRLARSPREPPQAPAARSASTRAAVTRCIVPSLHPRSPSPSLGFINLYR